jgi:DNA-binding HxlR family transcriptional regulator
VRDARPPRVDYVLTADGRRLGAVLEALAVWAGAAPIKSLADRA